MSQRGGAELSRMLGTVDSKTRTSSQTSSSLEPLFGRSFTISNFLKELKKTPSLGEMIIQRAEHRKSKCLPFRHEYLLFFADGENGSYIIRLDRAGKLGSLVKGRRWRIGRVGMGGDSDDCVRIERAGTNEGALLIEDSAGSDCIQELNHWTAHYVGPSSEYETFLIWKVANEVRTNILLKLGVSSLPPITRNIEDVLEDHDLEFGIFKLKNPFWPWLASLVVGSYFTQEDIRVLRTIPKQLYDVAKRDFPASSSMHEELKSFEKLANERAWPAMLRAFSSITYCPLNVLAVTMRAQALAQAWPKYNLLTANCELFSRSLSYANILSGARAGFSLETHGYGVLDKQRPTDEYYGLYLDSLTVGSLFSYIVILMSFLPAVSRLAGTNVSDDPEGNALFRVNQGIISLLLLVKWLCRPSRQGLSKSIDQISKTDGYEAKLPSQWAKYNADYPLVSTGSEKSGTPSLSSNIMGQPRDGINTIGKWVEPLLELSRSSLYGIYLFSACYWVFVLGNGIRSIWQYK